VPNRDWDRVERLLAAVEERAREIGFPLLRTSAICNQIVIPAEYRGQLKLALDRAETALAESETDDERFLLLEVTGRQLAYAGQWPQATKWLKDALALGVEGFPISERTVLLTLSEGIAQSDLGEATRYTEKAVSPFELLKRWQNTQSRCGSHPTEMQLLMHCSAGSGFS
jgi:hypothetical protein